VNEPRERWLLDDDRRACRLIDNFALDHHRHRFVDVAERCVDDLRTDAARERLAADGREPFGERWPRLFLRWCGVWIAGAAFCVGATGSCARAAMPAAHAVRQQAVR